MKILVTAGSTIIPIDRTHRISTPFGGQTGAMMADHFAYRGHEVILLTSQSGHEPCRHVSGTTRQECYRTYEEFVRLMEDATRNGGYDMIVHTAVVNDYSVSGVIYTLDEDERLVPIPKGEEVAPGHGRLFVEFTPAIRIIDSIRWTWGFKGLLVKSKLYSTCSSEELRDAARLSRDKSRADAIIMTSYNDLRGPAHVLGSDFQFRQVQRKELSDTILEFVKTAASQQSLDF